MFRGNSFHTMDPKGRIIIPTRFRDVLRDSKFSSLIISRMDGALVAYSLEKWQEVEQRILNMEKKSRDFRRFRRFFIGGSFDCAYDKQGRILIPPALREYAGFKKEIVLAGVLTHFEIWAEEKWRDEEESFENDYSTNEETRDEIAELGL
jgi:MraZ protein